MLLFPIALVLGLLTGVATGGKFGALAKLSLRMPAAVVGALAAQIALTLPFAASLPAIPRLAILTASYAVAGLWLVLNLPGRPNALALGLTVTAVGWLLNMAVVVGNGGMPVSAPALGRLGLHSTALAGGGPFGKHVLLTAGSILGGLGDTIAVPVLRTIVSAGDLVMLAGLVVAIAAAMRVQPATAG